MSTWAWVVDTIVDGDGVAGYPLAGVALAMWVLHGVNHAQAAAAP